jgi:hypothetical protein
VMLTRSVAAARNFTHCSVVTGNPSSSRSHPTVCPAAWTPRQTVVKSGVQSGLFRVRLNVTLLMPASLAMALYLRLAFSNCLAKALPPIVNHGTASLRGERLRKSRSATYTLQNR